MKKTRHLHFIAYLDQVLALGLGYQRLQLGSSEGVYQTGLRHDEKEHLGAGEDGELVGLQGTAGQH